MSQLPKGWVETTLESVSYKVTDGTHKTPKYVDSGVRFISIKNIRPYKPVDWNSYEKYITKEEHSELIKRCFPEKGDILFPRIGTLGFAKIIDFDEEVSIFVGLGLIKPVREHIMAKYLEHYMNSPRIRNLSFEKATGAGRLTLSLKESKKLPVTLAPFPEQQRIVEKLDEVLAQVDTIKARLDGIPAIIKRFRQSVLAAAVSGKLTEEWRIKNSSTDPFITWGEMREIDSEVELPRGWRSVKLGDVSERVSVGHVGKTSEFYTDEENGIPFLRSQNVRPGYISKDGLNYITKAAHELLKKSQLQPGDLLVVRVGANRGDSCVLPDMFDEVNCANIVFARPKEGLSPYLDVYFQSPAAQTLLLGKSVGGAQGVINTRSVQETFLALPSIEEQKEIVRLVDQYFAFADTIEAQVKKAQARVDNLTQSILAKAFRGELVPQDPDDEPADKLLERIAEARKEAEALAKAAKKAEAAKKRAAKKAAENA